MPSKSSLWLGFIKDRTVRPHGTPKKHLHGLKICGKLAIFFASFPVTLAAFKKVRKVTNVASTFPHSLLDGKVFHGTNSILQACTIDWHFSP
jgi:hypothetical protein